MAQRKRASQSKSKKRKKAPPQPRRPFGVAAVSTPDAECLGADVNAPVTQRMIGLAKDQLGAVPQFWGRYFKGPGDQNPVRYQSHLEGPVLRGNNIRVLPIAQQTNHVDGDGQLGSQDGTRNAAAIIGSFGRNYLSAMQGVYVFVDVEGPPNQSLHTDYYRGWSDALIAGGKSDMVFFDNEEDRPITFWPCVYGAEGDDKTWSSLVAAIASGAVCHGTWIARPGKLGCHPLGPWDEQFIRPESLPASVPILVWQGVQECQNIDYNRANPASSTDLMVGLVLPPNLQDEWLIS
jgi:hypothetical protein